MLDLSLRTDWVVITCSTAIILRCMVVGNAVSGMAIDLALEFHLNVLSEDVASMAQTTTSTTVGLTVDMDVEEDVLNRSRISFLLLHLFNAEAAVAAAAAGTFSWRQVV